jgi:trans-o-hydroxybenzylidenepyruvate hydratase-aldolase
VEFLVVSKSKDLIENEKVVSAWVIMPTPSKAQCQRLGQAGYDLNATARVVDGLVEAGVDGILALGTLGKCATLTWDEQHAPRR